MKKQNTNKMKTRILPLLAILLLGSVIGISLYAGETTELTLAGDYSYYQVTGNTSFVEISVVKNGSIVLITLGKYLKEQNLSITFYDEKDEEVEQYNSGGGGGGWVRPRNVIVPVNQTNAAEQLEDTVIATPEQDTPEEIKEDSQEDGSLWGLAILCLLVFIVVITAILYFTRSKEPEDSIEDIREDEK